MASLVVLDADRGDILAAANSPGTAARRSLGRSGTVSRLVSRAAVRYASGPGSMMAASCTRRVRRSSWWMHCCWSGRRRSGPELAALLAGLSSPEWASLPLAHAYDFGADAACYPAHAEGCAPWARRPGHPI